MCSHLVLMLQKTKRLCEVHRAGVILYELHRLSLAANIVYYPGVMK